MTLAERSDITIVGAGIVGVACARCLQRDGHHVRLLDPLPPGSACSYGNAGVFAYDMIEPLASPAVLASVPGMLLRRHAPFSLRWRDLPRLAPWLARFIAQARPARVEYNARALAQLCRTAPAATDGVLTGSGAAGAYVYPTGWLHVFETERGLAQARTLAAARRRRGVDCEILGCDGLRARLPAVADHVRGALFAPDAALCTDPGGLVRALAGEIVAADGEVRREAVHHLAPTADRVRVTTAARDFDTGHVVVATGIAANELSTPLGERFPLDTERGYHLMIARSGVDSGGEPGVRPALPVMSGEHKFVTTPMAAGLRIAGLSELGGTRLPPTRRRFATLAHHATRLFPGLEVAGAEEWMGFRPTLPDSLPVIGRSPRHARVLYAFGHQHLGLTLAGITGELIAAEVAGREPPFDPAPLHPGRWLR